VFLVAVMAAVFASRRVARAGPATPKAARAAMRSMEVTQ
jgi:hypothetical protein